MDMTGWQPGLLLSDQMVALGVKKADFAMAA